jgi:FkbM family methyltransferase
MRLYLLVRHVLLAAWQRVVRYVIGAHAIAIVADSENGILAVDPADSVVGRTIRRKGTYGIDELSRLSPHLDADCRVLVVGAHVGALVVPLAARCKEIVAIEANPRTHALLRMNIALNHLSNVRVFNVAASSKKEKVRFLMSTVNSGGSKRVPKERSFLYYYDSPREVEVNAEALDALLVGEEFQVIIMDVEGSEYFALQGMQRILSSARVLAVEFLPHHLRGVAGVSVTQFLELIEPHFRKLDLPSSGVVIEREGFFRALSDLYERDRGEDAMVFQK